MPINIEKKSEQILINVTPTMYQLLAKIAEIEARPVGYVARELMTRGTDLYVEDGKLREIDSREAAIAAVRDLHAALRACFAWAIKRRVISDNPCKGVDLPAKRQREIITFDLDEAARFTRICRDMPNGIIFELALETGMRPEEYLALRWSDIQANDITVRQAVQYERKGGGFYFKELKTSRSRRRIPISESLRLTLVSHRRKQLEHRMKIKITWPDHDLVFSNAVGHPFALPNLTQRYLKPIIDKIWPPQIDAAGTETPDPNAKHITLYSLRHSCASILLMLGENPKTVADRLGHASVVMTLDTYSHVLPHIQTTATNALDRAMRG